MENNNKTLKKSIVNLKQLPPLDPSNIPNTSSKVKPSRKEGRNPVEEDGGPKASEEHNFKVEDVSFDTSSITRRKTTKKGRALQTASNREGTEKRQGRAKSDLHVICAANKWKPPLFECCMEEGPSHMKKFTFKVTVEIRLVASTSTVLECFSSPQPTKKSAVEHAAEGALWFLKHLGYFSQDS